jgi:hypothetical protein
MDPITRRRFITLAGLIAAVVLGTTLFVVWIQHPPKLESPVTVDFCPTPPSIEPRLSDRTLHGDTVSDPFGWMHSDNSEDQAAVLDYMYECSFIIDEIRNIRCCIRLLAVAITAFTVVMNMYMLILNLFDKLVIAKTITRWKL